ncbi:hypothetical protein [uncultured Tateyamaria sp.]|uniref:hypothetical protein n=1 Tax=Tateyamaria sp. TaxID=1929288 RepID=UPI00262D948C|nr:hypothetical protein [uncultured Tateyamaria sp.]
MIRALSLAAILALTACAETTQAVDDVGRRSAKATVAKALSTRFPAVPQAAVTPFTDCVIDNASLRELRSFAGDAITGVDEATVALITTVLQRPETQQCIATRGLAALAA